MWNRIRLYFSFAVIAMRGRMMYRGAFIAGCIGQIIVHAASFLAMYFVVTTFHTLGGWNADQVIFLYGFDLIAYGLSASAFFFPRKALMNKIRTGEFDASLTKPMHPLAHELYLGFNVGYIAHTTIAIITLILSSPGAGFTAARLPIFFLMLFGAVMVYAAWFVLMSAFSFYFVRSNPAAEFLNTARYFTEYPITIYHEAIQAALTFLIPLAFLNFYPVSAILEIDNFTPFPDILPYLSPLVGAVLFYLSVVFWNHSMKRYKSTGT